MSNESTLEPACYENFKLSKPPEEVIQTAKKAADTLKRLLDGQPKDKQVIMNGERYLELDDWMVCGKFFHLSCKPVEDKTIPITVGEFSGFRSHAICFNVETGQVIAEADGYCMNDEDKWRIRSKFSWKTVGGKRVKEKVGEENVPLFQLASMAQTRACAKAYRLALSWIVKLAGYKVTPAEEMTDTSVPESKQDTNLIFINASYPGTCYLCNEKFNKNDPIVYDKDTRRSCHQACHSKLEAMTVEVEGKK
jgi:hypothetical protein